MYVCIYHHIFSVHDHQTLKEVGLVDTSYVSIEEGLPPSYEQVLVFLIFLFVYFVVANLF